MEVKELLSHCDHTLLRPEAAWEEIKRVCDEGIRYGCASVCIPPSYVKACVEYVQGAIPICTVIGFPNGYTTTAVKVFETCEAVRNGADEIDMVINLGWVKDQKWEPLMLEMGAVRAACAGRILKVIVEACLFTEPEKIQLCKLVSAAGADYIKTSTGFSAGGATREDVALFAAQVEGKVRVKAAGGIAGLKDGVDFLTLGADRLGTSRIVKAVQAGEC